MDTDGPQVMSGDTSTCGVHLDGAHQLLLHMWNEKKHFSEKTKTLHRIYCYLRIIWESTQVPRDDHTSFSLRSIDSRSVFDLFGQQDSPDQRIQPIPLIQESSAMSSFECIYGIPQNLLAMLEDTIKVIDSVDQAKKVSSPNNFRNDLTSICDDLEQRILDWTAEGYTGLHSPANEDANTKIIRHQTKSFHSALVIFFSQNVRSLNHKYLQQYVESILQSIEAIEQIEAETNMLAAPLFWPAFVAATTTWDEEHQARFQKWYEEASSYGIAAVRTGIRVIRKVWSAGPPRVSSRMCPWRHFVFSNGDNLMLS